MTLLMFRNWINISDQAKGNKPFISRYTAEVWRDMVYNVDCNRFYKAERIAFE